MSVMELVIEGRIWSVERTGDDEGTACCWVKCNECTGARRRGHDDRFW